MRRLLLVSALALSACGGPVAPELYNLVIDYFSIPNTCYQNGAPPTTVRTAAPPTLLQVSIWDGAANEAFLEIEAGSATVDMGAAPDVVVGGIMRGSRATTSPTWTFVSDRVTATTLPNINTTTSKGRFSVTFERNMNFKGTASLTSSLECTGGGCSGAQPTCDVSGVPVNGTRLQVNYQKTP